MRSVSVNHDRGSHLSVRPPSGIRNVLPGPSAFNSRIDGEKFSTHHSASLLSSWAVELAPRSRAMVVTARAQCDRDEVACIVSGRGSTKQGRAPFHAHIEKTLG